MLMYVLTKSESHGRINDVYLAFKPLEPAVNTTLYTARGQGLDCYRCASIASVAVHKLLSLFLWRGHSIRSHVPDPFPNDRLSLSLLRTINPTPRLRRMDPAHLLGKEMSSLELERESFSQCTHTHTHRRISKTLHCSHQTLAK